MSLMDDLLSRAEQGGGNFFGAALTLGADQTYNYPRTSYTQSSTALDLMSPTTSSGRVEESPWSQFWLDAGKAVVGYAIAKDAQKSNVQAPATTRRDDVAPGQVVMQPGYEPQQRGEAGLLPLLIIGGLVWLVAKG